MSNPNPMVMSYATCLALSAAIAALAAKQEGSEERIASAVEALIARQNLTVPSENAAQAAEAAHFASLIRAAQGMLLDQIRLLRESGA